MSTAIITTDTYKDHQVTPGHPENEGRVTAIIEKLKLKKNKLIWKKPKKFDLKIIEDTHGKQFTDDVLSSFPKEGFGFFDPDTPVVSKSKQAALDVKNKTEHNPEVGRNFKRDLLPYQKESVEHLLAIGNGANFSVPGSGKTTIALAAISKWLDDGIVKKIFVIGGAQIFQQFIHRSDELHITMVNEETDGIDTYFPVSISTIKNEFNKIDEFALGKNALYTHWVKNDSSDSF